MKKQVAQRMFHVMNAKSVTYITIDLHGQRAATAVNVLEDRLLTLVPDKRPCALLHFSSCVMAACCQFGSYTGHGSNGEANDAVFGSSFKLKVLLCLIFLVRS